MSWVNKEREKEYKRAYYLKTKEGIYQRTKHNQKKWRESNKEKINEYSRQYQSRTGNNRKNYKKHYKKYQQAARNKTERLDDGYMRKHLIKLGYPKERITNELIETHKIIIKTKRLWKQYQTSAI